ncbi:hypothetical protein [Halomarina oriensis]|uniref:Uncharacterized protein n=1 Tax=Halomarina oriensis TaxID=671145 RepID=A0A6B0GXS2_9EURY|nr:hypothetical protein [Halomarina oriensis]MWG36578.1 hypothetical protein [Halomarina oriensis]
MSDTPLPDTDSDERRTDSDKAAAPDADADAGDTREVVVETDGAPDEETAIRQRAEDEFERYFRDTNGDSRRERLHQAKADLTAKHEELVGQHQQLGQKLSKTEQLIDGAERLRGEVADASEQDAEAAPTFSVPLELGVMKEVPHDDLGGVIEDIDERLTEFRERREALAEREDAYAEFRQVFTVAVQHADEELRREGRYAEMDGSGEAGGGRPTDQPGTHGGSQ